VEGKIKTKAEEKYCFPRKTFIAILSSSLSLSYPVVVDNNNVSVYA